MAWPAPACSALVGLAFACWPVSGYQPRCPPSQSTQVPDVLVVANSHTYWVAVEALAAHGNHPIGTLAWGCGKAFPSQVAALGVDVAGCGPIMGCVWYGGDLALLG